MKPLRRNTSDLASVASVIAFFHHRGHRGHRGSIVRVFPAEVVERDSALGTELDSFRFEKETLELIRVGGAMAHLPRGVDDAVPRNVGALG
jgi:hypothetical protein